MLWLDCVLWMKHETTQDAITTYKLGCSMYIENVIEKKVLGETEFSYTTYDTPQEIKFDVKRYRIFAVYPCAGGNNVCKVQVHDSELDIYTWYAVKTHK